MDVAPTVGPPGGRAARQGIAAALGTACAERVDAWLTPHSGALTTPRFCAGRKALMLDETAIANATSIPSAEEHPADAPSLDRDRPAFWRECAELSHEVTRVPLHEGSELRRTRDPAGGGERLADLVGGEEHERAPVHEVDVRADGEDEHHVPEVHRLPPR